MFLFNESADLFYFNAKENKWLFINNTIDLKSYVVISLCYCRKILALAGFSGQIYFYKCKNNHLEKLGVYNCKQSSRIYAFHWLTCRCFLVCQQNGILTLYYMESNDNIHLLSTFSLPLIKERWTTCALSIINDYVLVGDRKGHLNLYKIGHLQPIQTIKRAFSHLGVTNLFKINDKIVALGRNGMIKQYLFENNILKLYCCDKLPFTWLANIQNNYLYGFSGDKFIIWHLMDRRIIFEVDCGGGHRSWDCFMMENCFKFVFIKGKSINSFEFDVNSIPKNILSSFHLNNINCLLSFHVNGQFF